jgi:tRNA A37 threonylcarbamoyladenosine dehydratase
MKRQFPSIPLVRRSVALPQELVDAVQAVAPEGLRHNLNRVVIVALQEFVARQKARAFAEAMAEMAADPEIDRLNTALAAEFRETEADGLPHD